MRLPARKWRWIGLVLVGFAAAFGVIRTWVIPAVLVSEIQKRYHGKVVVRDWWFGMSSAGISGVELGETTAADAPVWFSADRISTDVSIGRLLRGRMMPTRIEIDRPKVAFHLDAKGQPTTKIPVAPDPAGPTAPAKPVPLPEIVARDGEITLQQAGRKPMTIAHVDARLVAKDGREQLEVKTDDPTWGRVTVAGHFDPTFKNGELEIDSSPGFVAEPDKIERIPFIPAEVWANLEPRGPVDAKVKITLAADAPKPVRVYTDLTLKGTAAKLSTLQVESTGTTGHVVVDDAIVKVDDLRGKTLDGTIAAGGVLDFSQVPPRFDLGLRLRDIDVTKAPAAWQLGELGATGKLTGKVDLRVALPPAGVDLTGTAGEAVIENGSFQGIPIKSLSVTMKASGGDLQFETLPEGALDKKALESAPTAPEVADRLARTDAARSRSADPGRPGADRARGDGSASAGATGGARAGGRPGAAGLPGVKVSEAVLEALPLIRIATHDRGLLGWSAYLASEAVAYQARDTTAKAGAGGLRLPKSITTKIELEDVELQTVLTKAEKFGIKIPVPIAGRFSIKATATIPLGSLREIKAYGFHGDATLKSASIDHVDLGQLAAHLDLADGVLDLSDFRGQFVDHPAGNVQAPPAATAVPPRTGDLPRGGFRGALRAEIAPRGAATARIEGRQLPLGEVFAPFLPVPTPLAGEVTLNASAKVDLARLADPKAYALEGLVESQRIRYQAAVLDRIGTRFEIKAGRLELNDFSARLANQPLTAQGAVDIAPPYAYSGKFSVAGWELARVLAFIPGIPRPAPASGILGAEGEATGTGQPFAVRTNGSARLVRARAGQARLGDVAFRWVTDRDTVSITGLEAAVFGGKVTGDARIPTTPGRPLDVSTTLKGIDTARLSAALPGKSVKLSGVADGRLKVVMPLDASVIDAEAHLNAPDLHIRQGTSEGIRVQSLKFTAKAVHKLINYEATADSLGGKIRFHGSAPIGEALSRTIASAELQAAGFRLNEAWRGLGIAGGLAELEGVGAIDANIRAAVSPFQLWTRGVFELRELRYGSHLPLGGLRGLVTATPTTWRLDEVQGDLLGGIASGLAHGDSRPNGARRAAFAFRVDRASLAKMMAIVPHLSRKVEGYGSLTMTGQLDETLRASIDVSVPRARVLGLPISDVRFPGQLDLSPASGVGTFHARHWTGRLAGGSVMGNGWLRLGEDRSFQSEVRLHDVDLEVLNRLESDGKRKASGKLTGKITLNGPDPSHIAKIRGRVDVDLDDASLIELPVVRELDKFLGAARGGGLFEDGDLHGNISNRTLFVEALTLEGKLVQVHASGTVTFDGGLNLEVLINTNQTVSQSGLALVNLIPGLGDVIGRSEEVILRVGSFLASRLLKFRVTGTIKSPSVALDAGIGVGDSAVGFFSNVFKLPGAGGNKQ